MHKTSEGNLFHANRNPAIENGREVSLSEDAKVWLILRRFNTLLMCLILANKYLRSWWNSVLSLINYRTVTLRSERPLSYMYNEIKQ